MSNKQKLRDSLKALDQAIPGYVEADRFYKGTFVEPFQSLVMQRLLVRKEVNYKAVLSAVPVDAVVEKLEIVDLLSRGSDAKSPAVFLKHLNARPTVRRVQHQVHHALRCQQRFEGAQTRTGIDKMMQHASANDVVEALVQLAGVLDR